MREQRKHLLAELKALAARSRKGGDWTPQDEERAEYLGRELRTISDTLHENHQQELEEIRSGRENGGYKAAGTGYERSFAPEPLYQAFRSAGFARAASMSRERRSLFGDERYELEPLIQSLKRVHAAAKLALPRLMGTDRTSGRS